MRRQPDSKYLKISTGIISGLLSFLILVSPVWAAPRNLVLFGPSYGTLGDDYGNGVDIDTSSNIFVAGVEDAGPTGRAYRTIKYSGATGSVLFSSRFLPWNASFFGRDVAINKSSGRVYVTGYEQNVDIYGNIYSGVINALFDNSLNFISFNYFYTTTSFGACLNVTTKAEDIVIHQTSGNVFVSGTSNNGRDCNNPGNGLNFLVLKYDSNFGFGQPYPFTIAPPVLIDSPNMGSDSAQGIAVDNFQNIYMVGYTSTSTKPDKDWMLVKLDSSGNIVPWINAGVTITDSGFGDDEARAVKIDPISGAVYVAGSFQSSNPNNDADMRLVKYTSTTPAQIIWTQTWDAGSGSITNISEYPTAIDIDNFGSVFISMNLTDPIGALVGNKNRIIKYNYLGQLLWQNAQSLDADAINDMVVDSSKNVYSVGQFVQAGHSDLDFKTFKIKQFCTATSSLQDGKIIWDDNPLIPNQTKIRARHIEQLRQWINERRTDAYSGDPNGLPLIAWTNPNIIPTNANPVTIKKTHLTEMRNALDNFNATIGIYRACGEPTPIWTDPTPTLIANESKIRAVHIQELRDKTQNAP